jgi:vacuolar-type H+-ATPase subunit E/Vma4
MAGFFAILALVFAVLLILAITFYLQTKGELNTAQHERDEIQQKASSALARYQGIADLEKYKENLQTKLNSAREILPKFQKLAEMEEYKARLTTVLDKLQQADAQWRERTRAFVSLFEEHFQTAASVQRDEFVPA